MEVIQNLKSQIVKYSISGHAGFRSKGEDIVCAAVSSLGITITNEINTIDKGMDNLNNGIFARNIKSDDVSQALAMALVRGIHSISETYPKNVQVNFSLET